MSTATKPAAFPLPIPVTQVVPGATFEMYSGDVATVHEVRVYLGGMSVFYERGGIRHTAGLDLFRSCAKVRVRA